MHDENLKPTMKLDKLSREIDGAIKEHISITKNIGILLKYDNSKYRINALTFNAFKKSADMGL